MGKGVGASEAMLGAHYKYYTVVNTLLRITHSRRSQLREFSFCYVSIAEVELCAV